MARIIVSVIQNVGQLEENVFQSGASVKAIYIGKCTFALITYLPDPINLPHIVRIRGRHEMSLPTLC
jgi:hypothetical protein